MSLPAKYLHSILLQLPFGQVYFAAVSLAVLVLSCCHTYLAFG